MSMSEMPVKPVITSAANQSYQAKIDKLAELAEAGAWDAVLAYEVKGQNTYAKMLGRYRDALLVASGVTDSTGTEQASPITAGVTDSTASERMRRMRARKREAATAAPIMYERADWQLFCRGETLPQQAGCEPDQIGRVVLKELVDMRSMLVPM
jgi:hypothetical protein